MISSNSGSGVHFPTSLENRPDRLTDRESRRFRWHGLVEALLRFGGFLRAHANTLDLYPALSAFATAARISSGFASPSNRCTVFP